MNRTPTVCLLLCLLVSASPSLARDTGALRSVALGWFDGADTLGAFEGDPPAARVSTGDTTFGYVFFTADITPVPAYSGKPINVMVGVDRSGTIVGVHIAHHEEPILAVGISDQDISDFVDQYRGLDARIATKVGGAARPGYQRVDGISGATITVMVINNTITTAAQQVLQSRQPAMQPTGDSPRTRVANQNPARGTVSPLWRIAWEERAGRLIVLVTGLATLTVILILQDWLTRYPTALGRLRAVFLVYTLVFIGWYGLAQLSVMNVFTFAHSLGGRFSWDTFLLEPLMFVLWAFVAMTLLLWGRGVYCGWLCPFGALQELVNRVAQRLLVPQWRIPELVHERLLAIKYVVLVFLFGVSLQSMIEVARLAEVEPFKTAITMRFQRDMPYVAWALALVLASVFNGKLYCKYLCPLGAALAIGGRFRIFDWLHRRPDCGRPCQTCASECPSQAIRPTGEINSAECHHCLDCQMTFWNAYKCPPLVERRKRFERRGQPVKLTL